MGSKKQQVKSWARRNSKLYHGLEEAASYIMGSKKQQVKSWARRNSKLNFREEMYKKLFHSLDKFLRY